jgi:hypothetical protein
MAGAIPVTAAERHAVRIDAVTTFDEVPDGFTASGIPGCASGTVENGRANVRFPRPFGVFTGFKVFSCDGSDSGFVLHLNAMFGETGSIGSWSVVDAWGSAAGMAGAGKLTGDPIDGGIIDHYVGTVVG